VKDILSENPDSNLAGKTIARVSLIRLFLMFFVVSGVVGWLLSVFVYPFSCPTKELTQILLPEPELNSFVIRNTWYANNRYTQSLQQGLLRLSNVASIAADPFGFSPVALHVPDIAAPFVVSGPLRDLYDFPLVPPPPSIKDSREFLQIPGGPALFSFAVFMRRQALDNEYEKRQAMASTLQKMLETKRFQTVCVWLVISCFGVYLWVRIQKKPLTLLELFILICIGTIPYNMIFVPSIGRGSGSIENDTRLILVEHREAIKTQFREYVEKCFIDGRLDASARDTLLKGLEVPGHSIPEHFNRGFRTGSIRLRYFGVSELIDRNRRKGLFSVSCARDEAGAE